MPKIYGVSYVNSYHTELIEEILLTRYEQSKEVMEIALVTECGKCGEKTEELTISETLATCSSCTTLYNETKKRASYLMTLDDYE